MIRLFKESGMVAILISLSFLLVVSGTLWSYFALHGIHERLVIHFNDEDGITQLGDLKDILNLGLAGFLIVFINGGLARRFDERDKIWGKIIAIATLFLAVLIFIALAAIISVN